MAETATLPEDGKTKKKGGLITFIKKNKTLSAVIGVGVLYYVNKMNKEKSGSTESETHTETGGQLSTGEQGTAELAAYELGREERGLERAENSVQEVEEEREKEKEKNKQKEEEKENTPGQPGGSGGGEATGSVPGEPAPVGGVNIHGKEFPGANGSRIAKTGKTQGGKAYVEYVITFPGRQEHWQYFTATGNWRQVAASNAGPGANKPPKGRPPHSNPTGTGGQNGKNTHGKPRPAPGKPRPGKPPKVGIGAGQPAPVGGAPAGNPSHGPVKNAVDTGVSTSKPRPRVPAGWSTYKGANGHWWKKPS